MKNRINHQEGNGSGEGRTDTMKRDVHELSQQLLHKEFVLLSPREQHVIRLISQRLHVSRDVVTELDESLSFGQRMADKVASFGGSWTFILLFFGLMLIWIVSNSYVLIQWHKSFFDPYPFIFLNLVLSMMAAVQAPIILMSENRQAMKDRADATHDYEVNLKAELEIMALHEKLDALRERQWEELVMMQKEQIRLLNSLMEGLNAGSPAGQQSGKT
jgi:uncharacterized membrane protein